LLESELPHEHFAVKRKGGCDQKVCNRLENVAARYHPNTRWLIARHVNLYTCAGVDVRHANHAGALKQRTRDLRGWQCRMQSSNALRSRWPAGVTAECLGRHEHGATHRVEWFDEWYVTRLTPCLGVGDGGTHLK